MGLNFNIVFKGGNLPDATSIQSNNFKQLTPKNIQFLLQLGLKPKKENGYLRYWS
jgi:hypothetical protein